MRNVNNVSLLVPLWVILLIAMAAGLCRAGGSVEEQIDRYVASLPDPFSGTILLAVGDKILMNKGYGLANRSYDIPNTADTKYEIASTTKHFTAVLVLKMAEKGLLDLDATIDRYLPDYPKDKAGKIKIRHLLLHQSGIPHHYKGIPDYFGFHDRIFHTPREYLRLFGDRDLVHEPGEGVTYTSPGYFVLGVVLEAVTGKSYAELLEEHILVPLKMKNTCVDNNLTVLKNVASGYKKGLAGHVMALREEQSNRLAAGDMVSTTGDLYRFQRAMNEKGGKVLTEEYLRMLFEPQLRLSHDLMASYFGAIGTRSWDAGKGRTRFFGIGMGGSWGYRSFLRRYIELDACFVVLSNVQNDRAMGHQMFDYLEAVLFEEMIIPAQKARMVVAPSDPSRLPVDAALLPGYEGFYRTEDETFIGVFHNGRTLFAQRFYDKWGFDDVVRDELIPVFGTDGLFRVRETPGYLYRFTKPPSSQGYNLNLIQMRQAMRRATPIPFKSTFDLSEYAGLYYSVELQKTYRFTETEGRLNVSDFLVPGGTTFAPLRENLMSGELGFLVFHRYEDGTIRNFHFRSQEVDHLHGSFFIKK